MGFSAGREGTDFLVPDVHSLDLALAPQRVCDAVETVADDAVDALDAGCDKWQKRCEVHWYILTSTG